jgi:hypothetical protein
MATYLLTVETAERDNLGIKLGPGIRLSETRDSAAVGQMGQGDKLELRQTDGTITKTTLVTYGISVSEKDGSLYLSDDPADPELRLTVPGDLTTTAVAAGTEVWLIEDGDNRIPESRV